MRSTTRSCSSCASSPGLKRGRLDLLALEAPQIGHAQLFLFRAIQFLQLVLDVFPAPEQITHFLALARPIRQSRPANQLRFGSKKAAAAHAAHEYRPEKARSPRNSAIVTGRFPRNARDLPPARTSRSINNSPSSTGAPACSRQFQQRGVLAEPQKWPPRAPVPYPNAPYRPTRGRPKPAQVHPPQWICRSRSRPSAGSIRRETAPGRVPPRRSSRPPVPATLDEIIRGFRPSNEGENCPSGDSLRHTVKQSDL